MRIADVIRNVGRRYPDWLLEQIEPTAPGSAAMLAEVLRASGVGDARLSIGFEMSTATIDLDGGSAALTALPSGALCLVMTLAPPASERSRTGRIARAIRAARNRRPEGDEL